MGEEKLGPAGGIRSTTLEDVSEAWNALGNLSRGARLLARLRHLSGWEHVLADLGFDDRARMIVAERARANGTSVLSELLVSGRVDETDLFRTLARHLELPFVDGIRPGRIVIEEQQAIAALAGMRRNSIVTVREDDGGTLFAIAPQTLDLPAFRSLLQSRPDIARRLVMTPRSALRSALMARAEARLALDAVTGPFEDRPEFSAREVVNGWQGFTVGVGIVGVPVFLSLWPAETLLVVTWSFTVLFLGCVGLRFVAALNPAPPPLLEHPGGDDAALPVFSILIPLHREETVLPDLLLALGRIDWPRSKLEVKLICEADDTITLSALEAYPLRSWIEVVRVPPGVPRTKPRALNFALPTCTGELVALYDAEDRPHPLQLRAAWEAFRSAGSELACVQAPLRIANSAYGPLPLLFGIEYAAHFRGLLTWLARRSLLMPLGGTSNHFRRSALDAVGRWDARNVTEDADLGVRLM